MSAEAMRRGVALLVAVWATGCLTLEPAVGLEEGRVTVCGGRSAPEGWPGEAEGEELLGPFLECGGPGDFVEMQGGVDMPRVVGRLDEWRAVRLGALGPVREDAAGVLNGKRAGFLRQASERYGAAAEVLALYVLHTATDEDVKEVLRRLAREKVLGETVGHMPWVREELEGRGMRLGEYREREERAGDVARGMGRVARDAWASTQMGDGARYVELTWLRGQLPPEYQRAMDEVERGQMERHFEPGSVARGSFDALTFGVPLGFHGLVEGTAEGAKSLARGEYERATRELAPAVLMAVMYAGGKAVRAGGSVGERVKALQEVRRRLEEKMGVEGLRELGREIQGSREAGRMVAVGGVEAAVVLHEARGEVGRARAWRAQAHGEKAGKTPGGGVEGRPGVGVAGLVDEGVGLTAEVVEAKWALVEVEVEGARLTRDAGVLEKRRPVLDEPPRGAQGNPRWEEYVAYYEKRLGEVKEGRAEKGPLKWEAYEPMRGWFARGLAFERAMVERLRADAVLPRAERKYLGDFERPRVETYVGVWKPKAGLRFADVLVIEEQAPTAGLPPRVETFSFKSRNLAGLKRSALRTQMVADASEALAYYGEELVIRRPSLKSLVEGRREVSIERVRLIYEGGVLKPLDGRMLKAVVDEIKATAPGVGVLFQ
ncbi:hypothetical protein [Melittangium boletus]|uniref:Lipoprotein n=1 Tax=Melittangium boletus DSM 14713 TaxID=1294270 RepID=A0A250IEU6_9BACT|nr:hypothetical protein [Melittangium boletus]ATB29661.1 hypothetical protein MEBOL_003116 [Melittangium boletus DSM 14713]